MDPDDFFALALAAGVLVFALYTYVDELRGAACKVEALLVRLHFLRPKAEVIDLADFLIVRKVRREFEQLWEDLGPGDGPPKGAA